MVNDIIPDLSIEIPELTQVGFVVEDLEDGMERFSSILGIGPWEVYQFEPPRLSETTYHGARLGKIVWFNQFCLS